MIKVSRAKVGDFLLSGERIYWGHILITSTISSGVNMIIGRSVTDIKRFYKSKSIN